MASRSFIVLLVLAFVALSAQAFAPIAVAPTKFGIQSSTALDACRENAKKEKRKRNRENMRKFSSPGKRGQSRRKTLKRLQASAARSEEAEFISKCFVVGPPPDEPEVKPQYNNRR